MRVIKKQPNSKDCLICGVKNPYGVHASFYEMQDKSLIAAFSFDSKHQSYPERTHGGMISAIIDESIGRALWIDEPKAYGCTLRLNVEFHKAVPYNIPLYCVARLDKKNALTFHGTAEIKNQKGEILARGEALYMRLSLAQIAPEEAKNGTLHTEDLDVMVPDDITDITIGG